MDTLPHVTPQTTADKASADDRLVWTEPAGFRKAERAAAGKSAFTILVIALIIGALFVGLAYWFELGADAVRRLLIAGGAIAFFIVVLAVLSRFLRMTVKITDKAIVWDLGEDRTVLKFRDMDHCEIAPARVGSETYSVLIAELKRHDRETFCIDPSVSADRVRAALERRGVKVILRDTPLPENIGDDSGEKDGADRNVRGTSL
jgi:hypothetical protein